MLKVTRFPGESVSIGDEIEVVILDVRGRNVRLGISAPRGMKILRSELLGTDDPKEKADVEDRDWD